MAAGRTGGRILVDALVGQGAEIAFCVAGESYLEVLDAALDRPELRLITCRQEGGAAFMAEAYGKLTGRPAVCMVTRGPGACNASIGIHTAFQDSTPLVLLVGQVARDQRDREAFQEVDFRQMFGPLAKWVAQIDSAARIPEYVARAFRTAITGRPGPVVLALPEDMLRERADVPDLPRAAPVQATPSDGDMGRLAEMLRRAQRPLAIVGGAPWPDSACARFQSFAEAWHLPVACSFRRQDVMHNASRSYVGDLGTGPNPALLERVRAADLLLVAGARLGEITTQGYGLPAPPKAAAALIHVHADLAELGRVYQPDLAIPSSPAAFADVAAALAPPPELPWAAWTAAARQDYESWQRPGPCPGTLDLGAVFCWLRDRLPPNAIVTNDAGNFSGWGHRFLRYGRPGRQLGPTSGAMGYAYPAAVAAKITHPERLVLSLSGDGGFLMTGQELATAMHAGAAPIALVINNGMYGTIRMHQENRFPGRVSATDLTNPDFAALARSYGAFGATLTRTEEFAPAFEEAVASGRAAVIELKPDPEAITTRTTLSALRAKARSG